MHVGSSLNQFDTILVPRGAEYRAVRRGLQPIFPTLPIWAIPVGLRATKQYLQNAIATQKPSRILLLGLCGSLQPHLGVGDVVLYDCCLYGDADSARQQPCDRQLTAMLAERLGKQVTRVRGLTSDSLVVSADRKRALEQLYQADVVDMEGFTVLQQFNAIGTSVAMLRVVSDDSHFDLPDLSAAIATAEGRLKPLPLALKLLGQPRASARLIRGSLKALRVLQGLGTSL
ncbi:MAG: phosphorylase [Cyanobacteriota bacterium]|nr:phosphorylase [Cyanobacteriota bacterium]